MVELNSPLPPETLAAAGFIRLTPSHKETAGFAFRNSCPGKSSSRVISYNQSILAFRGFSLHSIRSAYFKSLKYLPKTTLESDEYAKKK